MQLIIIQYKYNSLKLIMSLYYSREDKKISKSYNKVYNASEL